MKKIKVTDLKPGMSFDQPVYIDPTNVLVQAKQEIGGRDIERLVKWGIREVETNGMLINEQSAAPATAFQNTEAPRAASADIPETEKIKLYSDYELMRKNKVNFRTLVKETAEHLQFNINALVENRPFDNHAILKAANKMVTELVEKKYLLLALYGLRVQVHPQIYHSVHAACFGTMLGFALNYSRPKLQDLMFSMLLMDSGMAKIPRHVLQKDGELNEPELKSIKAHPLLGYQMLVKNAKVKATLATVALQHHESFDGSGYPQSLRGNQIEETARIAAVADVYTAMIEDRPHRKAFLPYDAMKHMLSAEMGRFEPKLLRSFLGQLSIYPVGSLVELSSHKLGMVVSCRPDKPLRPLLRLLRDENNLPFNGLNFLDLTLDTGVYIIRAMEASETGIDLATEI